MRFKKCLPLLLFMGVAPASALTLGEGQILSYVGEPFAADIALSGNVRPDLKFYQLRGEECRASIIGAAGCDSLYEGALSFSLKRHSDGRYFLRVKGQKGDDLFYRIAIKYKSEGGYAYNAYEFLPEFKASASDIVESAVDESAPEPATPVPVPLAVPVKRKVQATRVVDAESVQAKPVQAKPVEVRPVEIPPAVIKPVEVKQPRLEIKKVGEYADDIHALQKENGEIEEQIVLLEKHINLLKEVIRLKRQAGDVSSTAPVAVTSTQTGRDVGMLTWILLAVVALLASLVGWMFLKLKGMKPVMEEAGSAPSPAPLAEKKSLDLTDVFSRPKW